MLTNQHTIRYERLFQLYNKTFYSEQNVSKLIPLIILNKILQELNDKSFNNLHPQIVSEYEYRMQVIEDQRVELILPLTEQEKKMKYSTTWFRVSTVHFLSRCSTL